MPLTSSASDLWVEDMMECMVVNDTDTSIWDMGYSHRQKKNSKKFHFAFCEEVGIGGVQRLIHFFSLQVYHRENRINFLCEIITKKLNKTEKQPPERRTKN